MGSTGRIRRFVGAGAAEPAPIIATLNWPERNELMLECDRSRALTNRQAASHAIKGNSVATYMPIPRFSIMRLSCAPADG